MERRSTEAFHWRPQDYASVRAAVVQLVELTAQGEYPASSHRIVLEGLHTGGFAALEMAVTSPSEVIAVVAGSGWLPRGSSRVIDAPWSQLENIQGCPTLLLVGEEDKLEYPYQLANVAALFERAGVEFKIGLHVVPDHDTDPATILAESQVSISRLL